MVLEHYTIVNSGHKAMPQRGFSLIELMIAMVVMGVGLLGGIVVIAVSTANNGRSKLHTTAAVLAESTMEKIVAIPQGSMATQTSITDCAGNNFVIETAPGGSDLLPSGSAFAGSINFSSATVPNYSMQYVMCSNGAAGTAYDVRWRVDAGPTPATQLVTVSAKPGIGNQAAAAAQFTLPVTLHQLRGNF